MKKTEMNAQRHHVIPVCNVLTCLLLVLESNVDHALVDSLEMDCTALVCAVMH